MRVFGLCGMRSRWPKALRRVSAFAPTNDQEGFYWRMTSEVISNNEKYQRLMEQNDSNAVVART